MASSISGPNAQKKHHVADDMHPATVHEHGSQNSDPMATGDNVGRNDRPMLHKRVTSAQFEKKHQRIDHDDQDSDHGTMRWAPGYIS
jgi:hypothetical protein